MAQALLKEALEKNGEAQPAQGSRLLGRRRKTPFPPPSLRMAEHLAHPMVVGYQVWDVPIGHDGQLGPVKKAPTTIKGWVMPKE